MEYKRSEFRNYSIPKLAIVEWWASPRLTMLPDESRRNDVAIVDGSDDGSDGIHVHLCT